MPVPPPCRHHTLKSDYRHDEMVISSRGDELSDEAETFFVIGGIRAVWRNKCLGYYLKNNGLFHTLRVNARPLPHP
jgi:hypothetical protein